MERRKVFCNIAVQADLMTYAMQKKTVTPFGSVKSASGITGSTVQIFRFPQLQKTPNTASKNVIVDVFKNTVQPIHNHALNTLHTTHLL